MKDAEVEEREVLWSGIRRIWLRIFHRAHSLRRHYPDQVHGVDDDKPSSQPVSPSSPGTFKPDWLTGEFRLNPW